MKKRNMKLPKRLLSMSLALSMCVGMACTTAFAEDNPEDYVYGYVGVDVVTDGEADNSKMPDFKPSVEKPNDSALAEAESDLDQAAEALDKVDKPDDFDADGALQEAVDRAVDNVAGQLESLENTARPEYNATAPAETESDETAEVEKPEFDASAANDRVDALDEVQADTDKTVSNAVEGSTEALKDLVEEKDVLDEDFASKKEALDTAKSNAEKQVEDASKAVQKCEEDQAKLKDDFDRQINDLLLAKPADTFRERAEGESEADYVAAQNAWVQEYEDYNNKVAEIKTAYDTAAQTLKDQSEAAQKAVADAQTAFDSASQMLEDFNQQADEKYGNLAETADAIKDHNEQLDGYNDKIDKYNGEVQDYNRNADDYNTAVGNYNDAAKEYNISDTVQKYDEAVGQYNDAVESYKNAAEKYDNDAALTYNKEVDAYNDQAGQWNSEKVTAQADMLTTKLEEELKTLVTDITVDKATSILKNTDTSKTLTDEEIENYNNVVTAYNRAVEKHNKALSENKNEVIDSVVQNYFNGSSIWTTPGKDNEDDTHWYCLGKIEVEDSGFAGYIGDFKQLGYGDIYTWEKDSDGTVSGEAVGDKLDAFQNTPDKFDDFVTDLAGGAFEKDDLAKNECTDLMNNGINKWALTPSAGANDGSGKNPYVNSSQAAWHLNGYLYVTQLNKLAALETHVKTIKEDVETVDKASVELKDDTQLSHANGYNPYASTLEVNITTPTETWEQQPTRPSNFEGATLDVTVPNTLTAPDRITVTEPDNTTPPVVTDPDDTTPPVVTDPDDTTPPVVTDPDDTDTDTNVPEEEVPLVEAPVVDVPEEEVPLAEAPVVDIPEDEVPLVEAPAEVEIEDDEVPLAAVPQTGDISALWYVVTLLSACGLAVLTLRRKEHG